MSYFYPEIKCHTKAINKGKHRTILKVVKLKLPPHFSKSHKFMSYYIPGDMVFMIHSFSEKILAAVSHKKKDQIIVRYTPFFREKN